MNQGNEKKPQDPNSTAQSPSRADLKAAADAILSEARAQERAEQTAQEQTSSGVEIDMNETSIEEDLDFSLSDDADLLTNAPHTQALEIQRLEGELTDTKDKLLRTLADSENLRRRAERDRKDAENYGGTKLARDILGVYDNLERALKAVPEEVRETAPDLVEGLELTQRELINAFSKHKITPVEPEMGDRFDPNLHQAMFEAPAPGAAPGTVIQQIQSGFTIADRLLRPALVGVAKADPSATETPENPPE